MKQINALDFVNKQVEVALSIERVRLAEKFISEKQMNFEMQYAIDLLSMALSGLEKLMHFSNQSQENPKQVELDTSWIEIAK